MKRKWKLDSKYDNNADTTFLTCGTLELEDDTIGCKYFMARDTTKKGLYLFGNTLVQIYIQNEFGWSFNAYDAHSEDPNTLWDAGKSLILMLGSNPGPMFPTQPFGPCHFEANGDTLLYHNIQFHTPFQLYEWPGKAVASQMMSNNRNGFNLVDYYCMGGQTIGTGYIDTLTYKLDADSCMMLNAYIANFVMGESNGVAVTQAQQIDTLIFFQNGVLDGGNRIKKYMEAKQYAEVRIQNTIQRALFLADGLITGKNTFDTLEFSPDRRYLFGHETGLMDTTIINLDWNVNGYCDQPIRLESDSIGTYAKIQYFRATPTHPDFTINNTSIRDIYMLDAIGGQNYIANNTVDLGHNSDNWEFTGNSGNDYYWIGGTGDWGNYSNWSYSSGGLPHPGNRRYNPKHCQISNREVQEWALCCSVRHKNQHRCLQHIHL